MSDREDISVGNHTPSGGEGNKSFGLGPSNRKDSMTIGVDSEDSDSIAKKTFHVIYVCGLIML